MGSNFLTWFAKVPYSFKPYLSKIRFERIRQGFCKIKHVGLLSLLRCTGRAFWQTFFFLIKMQMNLIIFAQPSHGAALFDVGNWKLLPVECISTHWPRKLDYPPQVTQHYGCPPMGTKGFKGNKQNILTKWPLATGGLISESFFFTLAHISKITTIHLKRRRVIWHLLGGFKA